MATLEDLKKKRDQLAARIQAAEAKQKASDRKLEARIKILIGSAVINSIKNGIPANLDKPSALLSVLNHFITRETDRKAVLGEDGKGSPMLRSLVIAPKKEEKTQEAKKEAMTD